MTRRFLPTQKEVLAVSSKGARFYDSLDNAYYGVPKGYEALARETGASVGGGPYLVLCAISPPRREIEKNVLDPSSGILYRTRIVLECTPPRTGPQFFMNQMRLMSPVHDSAMHGDIVQVTRDPACSRVTMVVIANYVLGSFQPSSMDHKLMFVPSPPAISSIKKEST